MDAVNSQPPADGYGTVSVVAGERQSLDVSPKTLAAPGTPRCPRKRKLGLVLLGSGVALVALIYASSHPMHDFIEYWSAAHLLLDHKNPYSLYEMIQAQKPIGWTDSDPLMFVSPPWALTLILPLGFAGSYTLAWVGWVAVMMAAVALSSKVLMDLYFGDVRIPEVTDTALNRSLFAFTFYPVILCLKFAQTAPLALLGLAGFLYFERKARPLAAGAALSLTLVKPQLLFLVWFAVLFRSLQRREWKVIASAGSVIAILAGIALSFDSQAFRHYHELVRGPYLPINPSGITGIIRRAMMTRIDVARSYWMQFVPPVIGACWFAWYWRRHRREWQWTQRMPALVTASVLTTAYGWIFDQTVLALPIIALASYLAKSHGSIPWNSVVLYTGLNCVVMLLMFDPPLTFIPAPILLSILMARGPQGRREKNYDAVGAGAQ